MVCSCLIFMFLLPVLMTVFCTHPVLVPQCFNPMSICSRMFCCNCNLHKISSHCLCLCLAFIWIWVFIQLYKELLLLSRILCKMLALDYSFLRISFALCKAPKFCFSILITLHCLQLFLFGTSYGPEKVRAGLWLKWRVESQP
jgi:hypothetical protein